MAGHLPGHHAFAGLPGERGPLDLAPGAGSMLVRQ
jgi:hypothetical protein